MKYTFTIGRAEALQHYSAHKTHWSYALADGSVARGLPVEWLRHVRRDPTISHMVVTDNEDTLRAEFMKR